MIKLRRKKRSRRTPDARMPMLDHLGELRNRIIISFAAVLVGAVIAYIFYGQITEFLLDYYRNSIDNGKITFIFTGPADAFVTRLKVATYGGIVLALPVWLYQLWRFITPGLSSKERKYAIPFVLASLVLFVIGAAIALLTLEPALKFLIDVGGASQ